MHGRVTRSVLPAPLALAAAAVGLGLALGGLGCNTNAPPRGPEEVCAKSCEGRADKCSSDECRRGCNLILDRLTEGQGDTVIACVAKNNGPAGAVCNDWTWAHCATRVGAHADGGPPAPAPPSEDESGDDGD
jgi:hypothetical protein